jgi:hypothetical protein
VEGYAREMRRTVQNEIQGKQPSHNDVNRIDCTFPVSDERGAQGDAPLQSQTV